MQLLLIVRFHLQAQSLGVLIVVCKACLCNWASVRMGVCVCVSVCLFVCVKCWALAPVKVKKCKLSLENTFLLIFFHKINTFEVASWELAPFRSCFFKLTPFGIYFLWISLFGHSLLKISSFGSILEYCSFWNWPIEN